MRITYDNLPSDCFFIASFDNVEINFSIDHNHSDSASFLNSRVIEVPKYVCIYNERKKVSRFRISDYDIKYELKKLKLIRLPKGCEHDNKEGVEFTYYE